MLTYFVIKIFKKNYILTLIENTHEKLLKVEKQKGEGMGSRKNTRRENFGTVYC